MKICFIGCSGHAEHTYLEMKNCPEAEFVGIAAGSSHEDPAAWAARGLKVFDSWQEMLDTTKPDVAVVCPVFGLTGKFIIECAQRGIDVFAEKPVAASLAELEQVEQAVMESGIHFCAMHYLRYEPTFYHALKLVRQGAIGDVRMITAQKSYKYGTRPDWFRDRALFTGTIPWVGMHAFDWVYAFSGKRFLKVNAMHMGNPETVALCQFSMEDGVMASVNIDYCRPAAAPSHFDDRIRVVGTTGILEVSREKYSLLTDGECAEFKAAEAPMLALDFLLKREEVTADEVLYLTKVALAARESADRNEEITI